MRILLHLDAEKRLRQTEAIHDVHEVVQRAVENSVELLSSQSHRLDGRQGSCVQLGLGRRVETHLCYYTITTGHTYIKGSNTQRECSDSTTELLRFSVPAALCLGRPAAVWQ